MLSCNVFSDIFYFALENKSGFSMYRRALEPQVKVCYGKVTPAEVLAWLFMCVLSHEIILLSVFVKGILLLTYFLQSKQKEGQEGKVYTLVFALQCSLSLLQHLHNEITLNEWTLRCLYFQQRGQTSQAELGHLESFTKISVGYRHQAFLSHWS